MKSAFRKPIRARITEGRIESDALKGLERAEVIVLVLAQEAEPRPELILSPSDPEWKELAGLCGCLPEELEQVLDVEWDRQAARKRFQSARRYGRAQARRSGNDFEMEEDVIAYLGET